MREGTLIAEMEVGMGVDPIRPRNIVSTNREGLLRCAQLHWNLYWSNSDGGFYSSFAVEVEGAMYHIYLIIPVQSSRAYS